MDRWSKINKNGKIGTKFAILHNMWYNHAVSYLDMISNCNKTTELLGGMHNERKDNSRI